MGSFYLRSIRTLSEKIASIYAGALWSTPEWLVTSEGAVHALEYDCWRLQCRGAYMNFTFNPLDHPDAEVTRAYFCQLTGRSRITAYRLERSNPLWPKPVLRGKRI